MIAVGGQLRKHIIIVVNSHYGVERSSTAFAQSVLTTVAVNHIVNHIANAVNAADVAAAATEAFILHDGAEAIHGRLNSMEGNWMQEARNGTMDMYETIARLPKVRTDPQTPNLLSTPPLLTKLRCRCLWG